MDRWRATVERIGARFETREQAVEAMLALRERFHLGVADVDVRPLGTTAYDRPSSATLLGGRFSPSDADAVVQVLRARGGSIVERRAEPDPAATLGGVATLVPTERSGRIEPGRRPPTRSPRRSRSP